jgi:hypothetical protein
MATAQGSNAQLIFGEESTFKTMPGTPAGTVIPFLNESLGQKTPLGRSEIITSNRNPVQPFQMERSVDGNFSTELTPLLGLLFKHALGTVATTGAGPYQHIFTVGSLPTGLWVEKGFTDISQYFQFNGCKIGSMGFSFSGRGGVAPLNIDIMGAKQTIDTSSADASPDTLSHSPFQNFEGAIEEGGSAIAIVKDVDFTIANNLDGDQYCIGADGERAEIPEGVVAVTGSITALFQSITLYNKAVNFTESSLKLTMTKGSGDGTAGNEVLELLIPELVFEEQVPPVSGPMGVNVTLPFQAFYDDSTEASAIQLTLDNAVATY